MSTGIIGQELELFWQKISYYFGQFAVFVRQLIRDPSIVSRTDLVMMCAAALIVALFVIGALIRFITEPWKKKGESLLILLAVLVVLAVIAFFVMRGIPLP